MMKRPLLAVLLLATLFTGCVVPTGTPPAPSASPRASTVSASPSSGTSTQPFTLATLPLMDGSTANIPLISLVIQRLTGTSADDADNLVSTSGTPTAWRNLLNGDVDLLIVYEADKTVQKEVKASDVKLEAHPIGRDALVFFTNSSNPVTSLSTAQYRSIYTGATRNWSKVGGNDVEIVAYQRPEESGSQALLRKYVMGEAKMAKAPADHITGEMGGIITGVASYANTGNALGYSVYYYLANMYAVDGITMLGADGVAPSPQTIGDGSYPYTNDFYAVVRADEPAGSPARTVMEWLLTPDGQQTVADAGYVAAQR